MKKIAGIILAATASVTASAATSDVLELQGTVAASFNIVVNDAPEAMNLDIINGEAGTLVATVDETANAPYKISATSTNGGKLTSPDADVAYELSYDGGGLFTPPAAGAPVDVKTAAAGTDTSNVNITFAGFATAPAGTYTDNVTFEIAAQ